MTALAYQPAETGTATTRPIADITVGPRYRHGIGKLRELQQSIATLGLLRPVPVMADGRLIVGARRLYACRNLGWDRIPVVVAADSEHAIELIRADQAETLCAKPMAASELVALGMQIEEYARPRAATNRAIGALHRTLADGPYQARDVAADVVGMSIHYYIQIRAVALGAAGFRSNSGGWTQAPVSAERQEESRRALAVIDRVFGGEKIPVVHPSGRRAFVTISAVHREWNVGSAPLEDDGPEDVPNNIFGIVATETDLTANAPRRSPAVNGRKALTAAIGTLSGLCHGLATIDGIDPAITAGEAASLERDLARAQRTLRGLHNKIKEHVNATR